MSNFLGERNLVKTWDKFDADFTHVHEANGVTSTSLIYHFCHNDASDDFIEEAGVIHVIDNYSDHCPIYCMVDCELITANNVAQSTCPARPSWRQAETEEKNNFVNIIDYKLKHLETPQ